MNPQPSRVVKTTGEELRPNGEHLYPCEACDDTFPEEHWPRDPRSGVHRRDWTCIPERTKAQLAGRAAAAKRRAVEEREAALREVSAAATTKAVPSDNTPRQARNVSTAGRKSEALLGAVLKLEERFTSSELVKLAGVLFALHGEE